MKELSDNEVNLLIIESQIKWIKRHVSPIRELAKSKYVRLLWNTSKDTGNTLFGGIVTDWDINKLTLVSWLRYYDSIYESMNCPPEYVVDNNKEIDDWVEKESKQRELDKKKEYYGEAHMRSADDMETVYDIESGYIVDEWTVGYGQEED